MGGVVARDPAAQAGLGTGGVGTQIGEWRGASQPRALPEPDVNLSIHPAPIIRPSVPGPNVRTVLDCDVLANATSPMSPLCGLETVCMNTKRLGSIHTDHPLAGCPVDITR